MRGIGTKARLDTDLYIYYTYCLAHLIPRDSIQAPASRQQAKASDHDLRNVQKPQAARFLRPERPGSDRTRRAREPIIDQVGAAF
jgi:hypothetical protein